MTREQLFHFFFLAVFLFLLYQASRILEPFLLPLLGAVVLGFVAYPVHDFISKVLLHRSKNFRTAISTLVIMILVVVPFLGLLRLLVNEVAVVSPLLGRSVLSLESLQNGSTGALSPLMQSIQNHVPPSLLPEIDVKVIFVDIGRGILEAFSVAGRKIAKNTLVTFVDLTLMVFILFFLFRDGEDYFRRGVRLVPMKAKNKQDIIRRLHDTLAGIIRGTVLNSLIQTVLAMVGFILVGVHAALTLAVLAGIASFIPLVGSTTIWVPMVAYYLIIGATKKGIFLLIWGICVIWFLDHLLRPFLIRGKTHLPILFLFFGLFGGAEVYGLRGVLIGPMVMTIIPVMIDIYAEQYLTDKET